MSWRHKKRTAESMGLCGLVYRGKTILVPIDPMKSKKAAWAASELTPLR
jgi:hypothetical protein